MFTTDNGGSRFRNHGCRIREYESYGINLVSLENELIKISIAAGKGADIIELVHKPSDTEYLWHSFQGMDAVHKVSSIAPARGAFLDVYAGGWQELFPSYGSPANINGAHIGTHGEACIYPWDYTIVADSEDCISVSFSLRTLRSPFELTKVFTLRRNSGTIEISQSVKNLSATGQSFMWGHHPAFGYPFIDDSVQLHLSGKPIVTVPQGAIGQNCPFDTETTGEFPILKDKQGNDIDMGKAYSSDSHIYMEYLINNLELGEYELINHNKGLGVRMQWDAKLFPNLWVWGMYCGHETYPWFGRAYTMAVEPWSCTVGNYEVARERGELIDIRPGEIIETKVFCTLFEI